MSILILFVISFSACDKEGGNVVTLGNVDQFKSNLVKGKNAEHMNEH